MVNAFDVKTEVDNALLVYGLSEFMCKSKCNLVLNVSRMFDDEYLSLPKLVYTGERSNASVVVCDTDTSRVFFVDSDTNYEEQLTFNKEEYFIKHHIRISMDQHKRFSRLIGMYCNLPKVSETFNSNYYKQYKVLELCILKIFKLSSRYTRLCTVYDLGLQPSNTNKYNTRLHLNDLVDTGIFTYCIDVQVSLSTHEHMYSYIKINYCGNINSVLQGVIMYMMDEGIDVMFSDDERFVINNKILELEVE